MPKTFSAADMNLVVVRCWVAIGCLGLLGIAMLGWQSHQLGIQERQRFQQCVQRQREDCQPSLFWKLYDLTLPQASSTSTSG